MLDDEILDLYERNQEKIDEIWEELEDDLKVDNLVFNYDPLSYPMGG